jgi:hypothetical protein
LIACSLGVDTLSNTIALRPLLVTHHTVTSV